MRLRGVGPSGSGDRGEGVSAVSSTARSARAIFLRPGHGLPGSHVITSSPFSSAPRRYLPEETSHLVVKLRLKRFGRLNHPTYRICAAESRKPRDGRVIETLGYYLPKEKRKEEQVKLNNERVQYWLSVGAQPSETVASLIVRTGGKLPERKQKAKPKRKRKVKPFVPPKTSTKKKNKKKAAPAAG